MKIESTFVQRDLMRKHAVCTVTIRRPPHHRLVFWLGVKVIKLGGWITGFSEVRIDRRDGA